MIIKTTDQRKTSRNLGLFCLALLILISTVTHAQASPSVVPNSSSTSAVAAANQFTGFEGIFDAPNWELIIQTPQIYKDSAALRALSEIVARYQRLDASAPSTTAAATTLTQQVRELGIAKVRFYSRYGLIQRIMSVRPTETEQYISKWRAYWTQEDRIEAAKIASAVPVQGTKVRTSALRLSPRLKQLLALGVETEAFDRALLASPDYLGSSPDDARVAITNETGCEEYFHQDGLIGGGYVIDGRSQFLTDKCISPSAILVYSCPQQSSQPSASPTPTSTSASAQLSAPAVSRRINCRCQSVLAPDKTETAKCI
jgi:hypothetical protein